MCATNMGASFSMTFFVKLPRSPVDLFETGLGGLETYRRAPPARAGCPVVPPSPFPPLAASSSSVRSEAARRRCNKALAVQRGKGVAHREGRITAKHRLPSALAITP